MQKYIKSLDGIRGVGILFVILYHFLRMKGNDLTVMGFSWIWIQMFFIQSGYLITKILLNSKSLTFKDYLRRFYWRRILRIFPLYFGYILIIAVVYVIFTKPSDFLIRLPYLLTYTYNFTRFIPDIEFNSIFFMHFWSLAVEEQFYLVWPFLIYFMGVKKLRIVLTFIVLLSPVVRYILGEYLLNIGYNPTLTGEIVYAFTFSQFDAFAMGAAIPIFKLEEKIARPGILSLLAVFCVLLIGALNINALLKVDLHYSWSSLGLAVGEIRNYQHVWSYSLINFMFCLVILYLIKSNYKGIFNNGLLVSAGKIVYGMYVFHFTVLLLVMRLENRYINNFLISYVIAIVLVYVIAHISYYNYEKYFLMLKDRKVRFDIFNKR